MSKAVVRIDGEERIIGDFSKFEPSYDDLIKLNQELRKQLIGEMELKDEIKNLKNNLNRVKHKRTVAVEELLCLKKSMQANTVTELLEAANKLLKMRRINHVIKK